jgi:hypothetical protein
MTVAHECQDAIRFVLRECQWGAQKTIIIKDEAPSRAGAYEMPNNGLPSKKEEREREEY